MNIILSIFLMIGSGHWEVTKRFDTYSSFLAAANAAKEMYVQSEEPSGQVNRFPTELEFSAKLAPARPEVFFQDTTKSSDCPVNKIRWSGVEYKGGESEQSVRTLYYGLDIEMSLGYDANGKCMGKKVNFVQHFKVN